MQAKATAEAEAYACPFCHGSGRCGKCEGTGTRTIRSGWLGLRQECACRACDGSGECQLCHGKRAPS